MVRIMLIALLTGMLPLGAAHGESEELSAAIDAYLHEDYRYVDVIARHAEDGAPDALAILGQAYLYGHGVAIDEPLGVGLLEQAAALGERSSAVHLGRVFEFGTSGIPADPAVAAAWYVMAARAGDTTSAPAALKRLPAATVIGAGGARWANTEAEETALTPPPTTQTATENRPNITPYTPPASPPLQAGPANPSARTTVVDELIASPDRAVSPATAILRSDIAPPPLIMQDRTSFPIFTDTRLSAIGDAAASCHVVLTPEIERQKLALESLMKLDGSGAEPQEGQRYETLAQADREVAAMSEALRASESTLADMKKNGGLKPDMVRLALISHREAFNTRPQTGPSAAFCGRKLVILIGESAAWPAQ